MNRPPKKKHPLGAYKPRPITAHFHPDNRELIEGAWNLVVAGFPITDPMQRHVANCIAYAVKGFHERLRLMHPKGLPLHDGEYHLMVAKPATFFDDYCMTLVIQDICNTTGIGVARHIDNTPSTNPQWGRCPDVTFVKSS